MQNNDIKTSVQFQNLVFASVFATLIGFLLVVGKSLLLPIFVAVISVYVLTAASDWLGKQPIVGFLPDWARRLLVLLAFIIAIVALTGVIIATAGQLIEEIPNYQKNKENANYNVCTRISTVLSSWAPPMHMSFH